MRKNKSKKAVIIAIILIAVMYIFVFRSNVFVNFQNMREQIGSSTVTDENQTMYIFTVRYMYSRTGKVALNKDVYCYDDGEEINLTVPAIDGYTPNVTEINYTIDDDFLDEMRSLTNVKVEEQEGFPNIHKIYYTVNYNPSASSYRVNIYKQKVEADGSLAYGDPTTTTHTENVYIGDTVETVAEEIEGYTLNTEKSNLNAEVKKDGADLDLYYDLNQHYLFFDTDGGTNQDAIPIHYGERVQDKLNGVQNPTKSGYEFVSWECIESEETASRAVIPETMPDNDLFFRATYNNGKASFTIIYYLENANDDGYTNIGTYIVGVDNNSEKVDTGINIHSITNIHDIIDEGMRYLKGDAIQYLTRNEDKSHEHLDENVNGDGTTNVKVYYDRKEYTVRFKIGSEGKIPPNTNGSNTNYSISVTQDPSIRINNQTYTEDEYTITAKYMETISDKWPSPEYIDDVTAGRTTYSFMTWGTSENSQYWKNHTNHNIQGKYYSMSSDLIIDPSDPTQEHIMYSYWSSSPKYFKFHIMLDKLDQSGGSSTSQEYRSGVYYEEVANYIVAATANKSGMNAPEITGVTYVDKDYGTDGQGGNTQQNAADIYFYYNRNEYEITFNNISEDYIPSQNMIEKFNNRGIYRKQNNSGEYKIYAKYGASLSVFEDEWKEWEKDAGNRFRYAVADEGNTDWTFDHWYYDPEFDNLVDWDSIPTVEQNVIVYANWVTPKYKVTYDLKGGTWRGSTAGYTIQEGKYVRIVNTGFVMNTGVRPTNPRRSGYTFLGWYYHNDEDEYVEYQFNASQIVTKDLELTAEWEPSSDGSYIVRYYRAKYDADGNLITDTSLYTNEDKLLSDKTVTGIKYNTTVTEEAAAVGDNGLYFVDKAEKSLKVTTDTASNVINFFYTPQPSMKYKVYYVLDDGTVYKNGEVPPENKQLAPSKEGEFQVKNEGENYDDIYTVTEEFEELDGYQVDAYKKFLVLTTDKNNNEGAHNAIYFYYKKVENKGKFEVNYYFMQKDGTYPKEPDYKYSGEDSVGTQIHAINYEDYLAPDSVEGQRLYPGHEFDREHSDILMIVITTEGTAELHLYFKNKEYSVRYDTMGGEWTDERDIYTVTENHEVYEEKVEYQHNANEPTAPTKKGYRFVDWYDEATDAPYNFEDEVVDDVNIYAKWIKLQNITVKKVWEDNNNQDGKRTSEIEFVLKANGVEVPEYRNVELNADNSWQQTIENLDVTNLDEEDIVYTVEELNVPDGYTSEVLLNKDTNTYTITNTHEPETKQITINKVWEDNNDQDGLRPENIELELYAGEDFESRIELSGESSTWTQTLTVPVYKAGDEIDYKVNEVYVPGYTTTYSNEGDTYTVTNTHTPAVKEITVEKVWQDVNDQDGLRPESVDVELVKDGAVEKTITLNDENGWTDSFRNVAVNENGEEISYTVREKEVPPEYTSTQTNDGDNYTITNSYTPKVKSITITKIWEDDDDRDRLRPLKVNVDLKANGRKVGQTIELNNENGWSYTVDNLPVCANGTPIDYEIEEEQVPNYTTVTSKTDDGFTITNTHEVLKTTRTVTKVWNDNNNQDGKRKDSVTVELLANDTILDTIELNDANGWTHTFDNLNLNEEGTNINYTFNEQEVVDYTPSYAYDAQGNCTITNEHTPEIKNIAVTKVWNDNSDQDGKRPENITINLLKNGEVDKTMTLSGDTNEWSGVFENLPAYESGSMINYTIEELNVNEYYTVDIEPKVENSDSYTITNTHIPETKSRTVTKIWRDGSNKDGFRPESIQFELYKNGELYDGPITLDESNQVSGIAYNSSNENDNPTNRWIYTFEDLPVYENGEVINWTVKEVSDVAPYGTIYDQKNLIIFNAYPPEEEISVQKVWDDEDNADGIRPDSVQVQLYVAKEGEEPEPYTLNGENIGLITLNEANGWNHKWDFVEKYYEGEDGQFYQYSYSIREVSELGEYTSQIVDGTSNLDFETAWVITNSYVPQKTSLTVNKVWVDDNNRDGVRPENITLHLIANGENLKDAVVDAGIDGNWTYTFDNINVNKNGKPITYTIEETPVSGYKGQCVDNKDGTWTVTNTHDIQTKEITVEKSWVDNNNQDGKRTSSVEFKLKADGVEQSNTYTLSDENSWKTTITGLPVYREGAQGVPIEYTLEETPVTDYVATYEYNDNNFKIINTHDIEKRNIIIEKDWQDDNNRDGIRPLSINVELRANGVAVPGYDNIILNATNNWQTEIENLDVYSNASKIVYSVVEKNIPDGYKVEYTDKIEDENKVIITNTHTPENISIKLKKVWEDESDKYSKRPTSVDIELFADGNHLEVCTLEGDSWETTVNYYKYNDGDEIEFTAREYNESQYYTSKAVSQKTADGYEITVTNTINTHDIKTRVDGIGGRITGQEKDVYETVPNGDSNEQDIVITPNEGYQIKSVTVNGVEQDLPDDITSEYTLPHFDSVTEDKDVVVTFEKIPHNVSTEVVGDQEGGTITGQEQDVYEVVPHGEKNKLPIEVTPAYGWRVKSVTINGEEVTLPENYNPREPLTLDQFNVTQDTIVAVEFERVPAKVTARYVTKNGREIIDDVVVKEGFIGDSYETSREEVEREHASEFENYFFIEAQGDPTSGTMDKEESTVTYVYEYRPNLYITKQVKGNYASVNKAFEFNIKVTAESGEEYIGNVQYKVFDTDGSEIESGDIVNGNGNVSLKHGQKVQISGIPEYSTYTIKELNAEDYTTYINQKEVRNRTTSGVLTKNTTIDYVNELEYSAPTGILLNIIPFAIGFVIVVILFVIISKSRKNRKE